MDPFSRFLDGLRADHRLGRYLPPACGTLTPETVILSLTMALADACEGNQPHPAHVLLQAIQERAK
jgi:hypothetical protein